MLRHFESVADPITLTHFESVADPDHVGAFFLEETVIHMLYFMVQVI